MRACSLPVRRSGTHTSCFLTRLTDLSPAAVRPSADRPLKVWVAWPKRTAVDFKGRQGWGHPCDNQTQRSYHFRLRDLWGARNELAAAKAIVRLPQSMLGSAEPCHEIADAGRSDSLSPCPPRLRRGCDPLEPLDEEVVSMLKQQDFELLAKIRAIRRRELVKNARRSS